MKANKCETIILFYVILFFYFIINFKNNILLHILYITYSIVRHTLDDHKSRTTVCVFTTCTCMCVNNSIIVMSVH